MVSFETALAASREQANRLQRQQEVAPSSIAQPIMLISRSGGQGLAHACAWG
jgi:hypothetical protein